MIRTALFLLTWLIAKGSTAIAQDCHPMTLAKLRQVYQASDRSICLLAEGFSLPLLKSDYSVVYHRCRKRVGYQSTMQEITLPELFNNSPRSRTIWFTTYDRMTYLGIQSIAQEAYQALPSLKSQSISYFLGYTDGKVAYLFDSVGVKDVTGATRFKIVLMPLTKLR